MFVGSKNVFSNIKFISSNFPINFGTVLSLVATVGLLWSSKVYSARNLLASFMDSPVKSWLHRFGNISNDQIRCTLKAVISQVAFLLHHY